MTRSLAPLLALPLALAASSAFAADILPVQGVLTDAQGTVLDGSVPITFRLYANGGGGTILWSEKRTVLVEGGAFAVDLGANSPIDPEIFVAEPNVHLGMQIDGDSEMDLIRLGSAPYAGYAAYAGDAATLDGLSPDDLAELYEITPGDGLSFDNDTKELSIDTGALAALLEDEGGFTAGPGLLLDGGEFRVDVPDLIELLAADFEYSAGAGVVIDASNQLSADQTTIEGWARGVTLDTEAELTNLLDDNYLPATYQPDWTDVNNVPSGFADGVDDNTEYTVDAGLTLSSSNVLGLDQSEVEDWAQAVAYDDVTELTDDLDEIYLSLDSGGTIEADVSVDGDLEVTGDATVEGSVSIVTDLTVDGDATVGGDAEITGALTVEESLQIGDTTASCGTSTYGTLRWDGDEIQACTKDGWSDLGTGGFIESDPFPSSKVVTREQGRMINGWVGNLNAEWTLCYRRSDHGTSSSTFHSRCNDKGPTVTVLTLNNGKKIGGYAGCSWYSRGSYNYACGGTFLFSITNEYKHEHRHSSNGSSNSFSHQYYIQDVSSYGPTFGGGHDLYIQSNMTNGYCNIGHDYTCRIADSSNGYSGYGGSKCRNDFCGSYSSWSITELEVWYRN